jgi:hypothetical protein
MCISLNACFIVARLNDWINQKQDQPFHEWSFSEEQDGRDAGITVCTLLAQSGHAIHTDECLAANHIYGLIFAVSSRNGYGLCGAAGGN